MGNLCPESWPPGSVQGVLGSRRWAPDEGDQLVSDFRHGERDQLACLGFGAPFLARMTVNRAWASIERVMCLYQPVYLRTW